MKSRNLLECVAAGNGRSGKCFCFQNEKENMIAKMCREESEARDGMSYACDVTATPSQIIPSIKTGYG